jgi:aerobic C4-dicarboxylate transport protein
VITAALKLTRFLYVRVLLAIAIGAALGVYAPELAVSLKPLGEIFVDLIKMLVAPIIFCTIVLGISSSSKVGKAGRIGLKALLYFEVVSTFALAVGLIAVNLLRPGAGFNVDPATLDSKAVAEYSQKAQDTSAWDLIHRLVPHTFVDAFSGSGDLLQVLLLAILFGIALNQVGNKGAQVRSFIESAASVLFAIVNKVMLFAPIGAFGAMSFTIGKYGIRSLGPMASLMATFYLTCAVFVVVVLGTIAHFTRVNLYKLIWYIRAELLTVLGTSSSESALAPLMQKLEDLGCSRSVVGLVVPAGYSFNLDGTNIYLTMAAIFIAQALNIDLSLNQQITLLLVATLTSKGASGVTGAGFITLAATLAVVPSVPIAGLALILGIDRFMSEARALTNIIGNGLATIVIADWENELDRDKLNVELK